MLDANINKESNKSVRVPRVYETLTKSERSRLRRMTIGHGNMIACELATGKHRNMIIRAMSGGRLLPESAEVLRTFLDSKAAR